MQDLWLRQGVYCADVGEALIFLDLESGRYSALPRDPARPTDELACTNGVLAASGAEVEAEGSVVDTLLEKGLLTRDCQRRNTAWRPPPSITTTITSSNFPRVPIVMQPSICMRFLAVYCESRLRSLMSPVGNALERLRKCKATVSNPCDSPSDSELYVLMTHFFRMRVFTYTAYDRCVIDSLVLAHFLLRNGVVPTLVIGVATRPFEAHCWVQSGPIVLNSSVENVENYTPILVV
jgi:hypothetical protein